MPKNLMNSTKVHFLRNFELDEYSEKDMPTLSSSLKGLFSKNLSSQFADY